ncbi:MAG: hypothetical protein IRZ33_10965 [Alicyclobacillaceae bacterium]|nr:hypothetical protein [Alicyclobacillaceae bacterium]
MIMLFRVIGQNSDGSNIDRTVSGQRIPLTGEKVILDGDEFEVTDVITEVKENEAIPVIAIKKKQGASGWIEFYKKRNEHR